MTVEERIAKLEGRVSNIETVCQSLPEVVGALVKEQIFLSAGAVVKFGLLSIAKDIIAYPAKLFRKAEQATKEVVVEKAPQPAA